MFNFKKNMPKIQGQPAQPGQPQAPGQPLQASKVLGNKFNNRSRTPFGSLRNKIRVKPQAPGQPAAPAAPGQPAQSAAPSQPAQPAPQAEQKPAAPAAQPAAPAAQPAAPAQPQQQPQAAQQAQPQQSSFDRRASGNNAVSNVLNFAGQNKGTAQNQAQMQAQQQQAQFLQQQQGQQSQQQAGQAPQQQAGQQPNRYSNLQQRMDGSQQPMQQGQQDMGQDQQYADQGQQGMDQGMPQMPKVNAYGQAQGLTGQAAGLTGTAAGLAKLAGAGGLAGKLGGAAGSLGAATQGLGAFNALASGDKVGGVDQMAGMAANFIPGAGPLAGAAYNMIPESMRRQLIGQGLKFAGQAGLDSNVLNVNQPGKMVEGLGKTGLNMLTGGNVGKQVLKSVTKSLPKVSVKVCHLAGTPIKMVDGSIKNIEDLKLGDILELGGTVLARGEAIQGEQVYDYNGIFVTGSHAVCENGNWMRVEDSSLSVPVKVDGLVYPLSTEENLIVTANGQVWADMNEVEDTYNLTDTQIIDILNSQEERNTFLKEYMDAGNTKVQTNGLLSTTRVVF